EAIGTKQKSIDEMLAEYKQKEKAHAALSEQKADLQKQIPIPASPPVSPDVSALQAQIMQDYQRDPVNTTILLNQAIVAKELGPIKEMLDGIKQERRDASMRENL